MRFPSFLAPGSGIFMESGTLEDGRDGRVTGSEGAEVLEGHWSSWVCSSGEGPGLQAETRVSSRGDGYCSH